MLETTPGKTAYMRQYPIPPAFKERLDKTVAQWLEDGTITKAPVNTEWNSPSTFAPKKDAQSNLTDHRPCLDPRHINRT